MLEKYGLDSDDLLQTHEIQIFQTLHGRGFGEVASLRYLTIIQLRGVHNEYIMESYPYCHGLNE